MLGGTMRNLNNTAEQKRLNEAREQKVPWKKWGPYLSERQWGTVREDYSDNGDAWSFSATIKHVHAPTIGARMAWPVFPTRSSGSALRSPCGTSEIPLLRNGSLGSPTARATTARMSRSTISISTRRQRTRT